MRRIIYVCGSLILLALSAVPAEGGPIRRALASRQPVGYSVSSCSTGSCPTTTAAQPGACADGRCSISGAADAAVASTTATATASVTALEEVNAKRAARGLRPFANDPLLAQAAERCAAFRAERGLFGHTANDFAFVPPGGAASAAGCAAYPASYGWMSCCVYDNHTHAGAAWVTGRDGRRYMHLFVR